MYAIERPSGENDGCASTPAKFVTALKRISAAGRSGVPRERAIAIPAATSAAAATAQGMSDASRVGPPPAAVVSGSSEPVLSSCKRASPSLLPSKARRPLSIS
jgi:hypothetical protein